MPTKLSRAVGVLLVIFVTTPFAWATSEKAAPPLPMRDFTRATAYKVVRIMGGDTHDHR